MSAACCAPLAVRRLLSAACCPSLAVPRADAVVVPPLSPPLHTQLNFVLHHKRMGVVWADPPLVAQGTSTGKFESSQMAAHGKRLTAAADEAAAQARARARAEGRSEPEAAAPEGGEPGAEGAGGKAAAEGKAGTGTEERWAAQLQVMQEAARVLDAATAASDGAATTGDAAATGGVGGALPLSADAHRERGVLLTRVRRGDRQRESGGWGDVLRCCAAVLLCCSVLFRAVQCSAVSCRAVPCRACSDRSHSSPSPTHRVCGMNVQFCCPCAAASAARGRGGV
jgi:hypothetical protein